MKLERLIERTLLKLDTNNDEHWLLDGRPNPQAAQTLANNPAVNAITIAEHAPDYRRDNRVTHNSKKEGTPSVDFSFNETDSAVEETVRDSGQELTVEQIDVLLKEKQQKIDELRAISRDALLQIDSIITVVDDLQRQKDELNRVNPISLEEMERMRYLHAKQQERDRMVLLAQQIKSVS